jgi:uncharacterized protein YcbK (DUF882 family)
MVKMSDGDWKRLRHFSPAEAWGNPAMMERETVFLLDGVREAVGRPIVIHCGYERRPHRPASRHNDGSAVDFHILGVDFRGAVGLVEGAIEALGAADRVGLGIYPHWKSPGFHLDTRGRRARWGAVNRGGKQTYVSYNEALTYIK